MTEASHQNTSRARKLMGGREDLYRLALVSLAALKGSKFRAYNPVTARFAEELGAQPTTVQVPAS